MSSDQGKCERKKERKKWWGRGIVIGPDIPYRTTTRCSALKGRLSITIFAGATCILRLKNIFDECGFDTGS